MKSLINFLLCTFSIFMLNGCKPQIDAKKEVWIIDNIYDYGAVHPEFEFSRRGDDYEQTKKLTFYIQGNELVLNDTARIKFNPYKIDIKSFLETRFTGLDYAYQLDILRDYYSVDIGDTLTLLKPIWPTMDDYFNSPSIIRQLERYSIVHYDSCYLTIPYNDYLVVFKRPDCPSANKKYELGKYPSRLQKLPLDFKRWLSQYSDGIETGEFNLNPINEDSFLSDPLRKI